eukprot:scaffold4488_cov185-Alexandrium_tamarense.AAC.19
MEEIHKKHGVECDVTQTPDDDTLTQATAASRMSHSTVFTSGTGTTMDITISQEDIAAFERGLSQKEQTLRNTWEGAKRRHRNEEDAMQKEIADLQAKRSAVESDRRRINESKLEAMRELQAVGNQMSSAISRVRQSDVDEAKKQAADLARTRDELNNGSRRDDIAKEIKVQEDKLKSIASRIEQDMKIRKVLNDQKNEQSEIDMLEKQVSDEFLGLKDMLKDNSYVLSEHGEHNVTVTTEDPVSPVEVAANNIRRKHLDAEDDVNRANEAIADLNGKIAEKRAVLSQNNGRLQQLKNRANQLNAEGGAVQKVNNVVSAILRSDLYDPDLITADSKPSEIMQFLQDAISELSAIDVKPEVVSRILKPLKKKGKTDASCPCCLRDFVDMDETTRFMNQMNALVDPDTSELMEMISKKNKESTESLERFEKWRTAIAQNINECIEYTGVNNEIKDLEAFIAAEGEGELKDLQDQDQSLKEKLSEKQKEASSLRTLLASLNTILDTARRIWTKEGQVKEKKEKLKYAFGYADLGNETRDLNTVEADLTKSNDAKEAAYTEINRLNGEQKDINDKISRVTNQAAAADRNAREKQDAFTRDQEASKRRDELNQLLGKLGDDDKELEKSLAPIRTHLLQKESDRDRMRTANGYEESKLGEELRGFEKDISRLAEITDKIDFYDNSNKEREILDVETSLNENADAIKDEEAKLVSMKPEIEQLKKQVDDSERQKQKIQNNIDVLKLQKEVNDMEEEIGKLEDDAKDMGGEDAARILNEANTIHRESQEMKAVAEGKRQMLAEQRRALKRKLNEPEYKDVEERHRVKMIEYETTNIVVGDLDKYYDALDKALLRYHGMKINDINKIIKELWALTYKGEDITNIQITSDQDKAGRAARSYNYRIVMSKGNTTMDMRGRCSAGQRVLASIVIRLALAETFCLNCGVMALDEPTTNLDYENKRGLAIALAQIIASRAAQSNFQLVVITHDEDFVSMMKNELSSQTGFNMPERYYQVSREEGHDGRFYSKINAIDWDEL